MVEQVIKNISQVTFRALQARDTPGMAWSTSRNGQIWSGAAGGFTYAPDSPSVSSQTFFDIASITKPLAGVSVCMLLAHGGKLDINQPIIEWLPEFASDLNPSKRKVTIRMLLAHTSGLPAHRRLWEVAQTREALISEVCRTPLEVEPGTQVIYSDLGFILLCALLERVTGERLDSLAQRRIFAPLGMTNTFFCPSGDDRQRAAPTNSGTDFRGRLIQGEVHDENCAVMDGVSAHAGIFSTAEDLAKFAQCLLRGGAPLFTPETIATFTRREVTPTGTTRTLGWDTPSQPSSSGRYFSPHSFGHLGFTGTSLWIDPEADLAVVLLTNRVWPDSSNTIGIQQFRPAFHDAVREELGLT